MNIAMCGGSIPEAQAIIELINRIEPNTHNIELYPVSEMYNNIKTEKYYDLFICNVAAAPAASLHLVQKLHDVFSNSLIVIISDSGSSLLEYSEYIWRYEITPLSVSKVKYILAKARMLLAPKTIALPVSGHERLMLNLNNIVYFEIYDKTGIVHTTDHQKLSFRSTLSKIESDLVTGAFFKPHKSYLVNIQHIKYITESAIIMVDDSHIPLSRNRKNTLFRLLSNYTDIIFT